MFPKFINNQILVFGLPAFNLLLALTVTIASLVLFSSFKVSVLVGSSVLVISLAFNRFMPVEEVLFFLARKKEIEFYSEDSNE